MFYFYYYLPVSQHLGPRVGDISLLAVDLVFMLVPQIQKVGVIFQGINPYTQFRVMRISPSSEP